MMITIYSNAHIYGITQEKETRAVSMVAEDNVAGWGMLILSIVVGLLALCFFLAMGGIYALVGPWMIFAVTHLVQQKRVRKAGEHVWKLARQLAQRQSARAHMLIIGLICNVIVMRLGKQFNVPQASS
jgi:hypothetical protein